jgi:hypothetical protein
MSTERFILRISALLLLTCVANDARLHTARIASSDTYLATDRDFSADFPCGGDSRNT